MVLSFVSRYDLHLLIEEIGRINLEIRNFFNLKNKKKNFSITYGNLKFIDS